jgi:hypothetical protein
MFYSSNQSHHWKLNRLPSSSSTTTTTTTTAAAAAAANEYVNF